MLLFHPLPTTAILELFSTNLSSLYEFKLHRTIDDNDLIFHCDQKQARFLH
jgi:hypothetical protein